jgi:pimeloyl-ACP methyl ester carboxylesterase
MPVFNTRKVKSLIDWEDFRIETENGASLALSRTINSFHASTVLMLPGFTSKRMNTTNKDMTGRLVDLGIQCIVADLSGHGDSSGDIADQTVVRASKEIGSIIDAISDCGIVGPREPIAILGNSFSANAVLLAAAKRNDLNAIILKSPVTDYVQMRYSQLGEVKMSQWKSDGWIFLNDGTKSNYQFIEDAANVDSYGSINNISCPLLAVHGSMDTDIPKEQIKLTRETILAAGGEHVLFSEADHGISGQYFTPCMQLFTGFLLEHIPTVYNQNDF